MKQICSESIDIAASPEAVWAVITDIENAENTISAIEKIEVLERGSDATIVGLKWRETRQWMGREAVEVMWITDAREPSYYETRAESHGSIYQSRLEITPTESGSRLTMSFSCQPQTGSAKMMWALTGWMAKRSMRKAIAGDLEDIQRAAERA